MTLSDWLQREFDCRRARNRRYLLRGFARQLGLHHATLLRLLAGQPGSSRSVQRIVRRLCLDASLGEQWLAAQRRDALAAAVAAPGFRASTRWLAVRTGMTADAVNIALHGLLAQGRLQMRSRSQWAVTDPHPVEPARS